MDLIKLSYEGGSAEALAAFGLDKTAMLTPEQKQQMLAAYRARPTGIAHIQQQAAPPGPVPNVPQAQAGWAPPQTGGPGTAPGFQVAGGLPLEPVHQPGPTSMTGAGSIPGQAALAQQMANRPPVRTPLLAHQMVG